MSDKYTTARITKAGEKFEILVKPAPALDYKMGKPIPMSQMLAIDEIYADAGKGTHASDEKLQKAFGTTDPLVVAEDIMKHGELQLTTEQRRQLVDDKRKQIVAFVSRNCIDPRTGTPHPPLRIEQAFNQIRLVVDPFKPAEEQARAVIEELRTLLPIKIDKMKVAVKIFPEHAAKAYGSIKGFGTITKEEWQADGSLVALVEMPAGLYGSFIDRLGKLTQGTVQTKVLK
jgi:ribosome maturation protein SDO1